MDGLGVCVSEALKVRKCVSEAVSEAVPVVRVARDSVMLKVEEQLPVFVDCVSVTPDADMLTEGVGEMDGESERERDGDRHDGVLV